MLLIAFAPEACLLALEEPAGLLPAVAAFCLASCDLALLAACLSLANWMADVFSPPCCACAGARGPFIGVFLLACVLCAFAFFRLVSTSENDWNPSFEALILDCLTHSPRLRL